jgi:hypothetical protein
MFPPTRIVGHLVVVGAALVTVAIRPALASPSSAVADAAVSTSHGAASYVAGSHVVARRVVARRASSTALHTRPRPQRRHRQALHVAPATRSDRPPRRHAATRAPSGPTTWAALDAAIARIPGNAALTARWVVSNRYGHWGTADWYHDTLYVSPSVPSGYLYDVAVHEWSHELSVLDYAGDVGDAVTAMNRYFGGSGLVGAERAADCMARLQGATWTHYTSCSSTRWRAGARVLLRGRRL